MKQVIVFNSKNVILPEPWIIPNDQLPLGMRVYDGDVNIQFKYRQHQESRATIYYAINNIFNWNLLGTNILNIPSGSTVYFYGPANNILGGDGGTNVGFNSSGTGKIDLIGNFLSLCNPDWTNNTIVNQNYDHTFDNLFCNLKNNLYNAKDMIIRTNTINGNNSYNIAFGNLFRDCSHLLTPPQWICENNTLITSGVAIFITMFQGCSSLQYVELPPITSHKGNREMEAMLYGCSSLSKIIYKGTLTINFTNFSNGVPASGDFYNLGGATYATGTNGIPSGWTVHTSL